MSLLQPLTYERTYSGDNWLIAQANFGDETWSITTDHVHASEFEQAENEEYLRLWSAAPALLALCMAQEAYQAHRDACEICGPEEYDICIPAHHKWGDLDDRRKAVIAQATQPRETVS